MVGLIVTSSKRAFATRCMTRDCCNQSPCPCGRPLLTCVSTGDIRTLKGRSGSVSVGYLVPVGYKVLFESSKCLWWMWGLIQDVISPLLPSCWGFSFALGRRVFWFFFFGGIQQSPVNGCSAASCTLGVLTGEDKRKYFYSAIFYQGRASLNL